MRLKPGRMVDIAPIKAALVDAAPSYNNRGSDYTATSLIRSPRQVQLGKRHGDKVGIKLIEDPEVIDSAIVKRIASIEGTAVHDYFEHTLKETPWKMGTKRSRDWLVEHRFFDEIVGRRVSAQIDVYSFEHKILYDYKRQAAYVRSVGGEKWEDKLMDVEIQLNIGAYFARKEGLGVEGVACIPIYKDWNPRNTYNPNYPQTPIEQWDLRLWDMLEAEEFLYDTVNKHKMCEDLGDDDLPECSLKDCWERPAACAVMKYGRKTAITKNVPKGETWEAAVDFITKSKDKDSLYIRKTTEQRTKCAEFCDVNIFCNQYKKWLEGNAKPGAVVLVDIHGNEVDV